MTAAVAFATGIYLGLCLGVIAHALLTYRAQSAKRSSP